MSNASAETREFEAIRFLGELPGNLGGVLVGGYAVSAYGPARFSEDVDLAFPHVQESSVLEWLAERGILSKRTFGHAVRGHALSRLRITEGQLSGDLYFGGMRARDTGTVIDYSWIAERYRMLTLVLQSGRLESPIAVARPEALWVLKLLAGRNQDIGDLFSITPEPVDVTEIEHKLSSFDSPGERKFLAGVREAVEQKQGYADALSRRGLGSPKLPRNLKAWSRFQSIVDEAIPKDSVQ